MPPDTPLTRLATQADAASPQEANAVLPRPIVDDVHRRLAQLPAPLADWALRLGVHRTITAASLDVLPEQLVSQARVAIDALVREGLLVPDENREATWSVDPMVHRAITQRRHDQDPRASRRMHNELVTVLAMADDPQLDEDLLHHARWAARWDVLSQLWWRTGQTLLFRGSPVAAWAYHALPPGVAGRYPTLALAELIVDSASGGVHERNGRLLRAIASGSAAGLVELTQTSSAESVLATGTLHIIALCHTGDPTAANVWVDAVEAELARRDDGGSTGARRQFQVEAAAARMLVGRTLDVRHYAGAVLAESSGREDDPDPAVQRARGQLALVSSILGWPQSRPAFDAGYEPEPSAPLSIRIALAHRAADDLDRDWLRRLIDGMDEGQSPLWAFVLVARTLLALLEGRPLDDVPRLDLAESDHREWLRDEGFAFRLLRRCRSELLLAGGELQRASAILLTREPLAPELRVPLARLYLHTEQPRTALDFVTQVLTDPALSPRERGTFETIRTVAHLIIGQEAEAREVTRTMFARYPGMPPGWSVQTMLLPRELRLRLLDLTPDGAVPSRLAERLTRFGGPLPAPSPHLIALTPRERIVVAELRRGGTLAEIGARLCVSSNTLKKQTISIYRKLDVDGREAAVRRAITLGLLDREP